jgi:PAS domain S-box-containing protein
MASTDQIVQAADPASAFRLHGGELGRLVASFDWASTSLGPIADWPQSLKTAVGIVLMSPVPMVMLWGDDGFMVYNDAYSVFAGGRHPALLGSKVREAWPEVSDFNDNMMHTVLGRGETLAYRDQELELNRTGVPEPVWMNLDYSPILDDRGERAGVIAIVVETTERVRADQALRAAGEAAMRTAAETAAILGQLGEGVIVTNCDGVITFVNDAAERLHGVRMLGVAPGDYTQSYHLLTESGDPYPPHDLPLARAVLRGETVIDARWRIARPDGSEVLAIGSARPIADAQGALIGAVLTVRDDTERRRSEVAVAESEARFRNMADHAPVMMWVTDQTGSCTYLNHAWYAFTDQTEADALGLGWTDMTHPDDRAAATQAFLDANAVRRPFRTEYRLRRADGAYRYAIDAGAPRFGEDGSFLGFVGSVIDIDDRREVEERLRELNESLEQRVAQALAERKVLAEIIEGSDAIVQVIDFDYRWLAINRAASVEYARIFGLNPSVGDNMLTMFADRPQDRDAAKAMWSRALAGEEYVTIAELGDPSRERRHYEIKFNVLRNAAGVQVGAYQFVYDVTERLRSEARLKDIEEQLRQSQKMEAVGQLTGGIAHDFNNLLQVIVGNLELLLRGLPPEPPRLRRAADNAMMGATRAATLTQRLLAFSRRQPLAPRPIAVNQLVIDMSDLLVRTLGETIALRTVLSDDLWLVDADPNQLESALLNLAVNARDAMPAGGSLTIETLNGQLDEAYARNHAEIHPGEYLVIAVTDSGTGMDAATLARIFEPFFTTKEVGKGTGLGLSMIYGFVKQSGGHVKAYSEPGLGTTIKIYLPRFTGVAGDEPAASSGIAPQGDRSETVLVVEDDADVRAYSVSVLGELGYAVHEAGDGPAALGILNGAEGATIDLLFTDVVLPAGMSGADLAAAAVRRRPGLKVLFTTGYARDAIVHHGRLDPGVELITKPFTYADLAARVRQVLDR